MKFNSNQLSRIRYDDDKLLRNSFSVFNMSNKQESKQVKKVTPFFQIK